MNFLKLFMHVVKLGLFLYRLILDLLAVKSIIFSQTLKQKCSFMMTIFQTKYKRLPKRYVTIYSLFQLEIQMNLQLTFMMNGFVQNQHKNPYYPNRYKKQIQFVIYILVAQLDFQKVLSVPIVACIWLAYYLASNFRLEEMEKDWLLVHCTVQRHYRLPCQISLSETLSIY